MSLHEITKIAAGRTLLAAASCPRDISGGGKKEILWGRVSARQGDEGQCLGQQQRDDCNTQACVEAVANNRRVKQCGCKKLIFLSLTSIYTNSD